MNKFRNKTFLLSMIAFIVLVIKTFTSYELPGNFDALVDAGLAILTGLGIVNDTTSNIKE